MDNRHFTVVDLFAGCGGLSSGLLSTGDFRVTAAIDMFSDALHTYSQNHPGVAIFNEDIRLFDVTRIESLRKISPVIDVVVGGPPCEGFSQNKRREFQDVDGQRKFGRNLSFAADPRNLLFREFLRFVQVLAPKIVLIENVPQMLTHAGGKIRNELLLCLRELGYLAEARILLASDYGVPQKRRRAFILGIREDLHRYVGFPLWPSPTHGESCADDQLVTSLMPIVTVRNAIADLPSAVTKGFVAYDRDASSDFARLMRRNATGVTWHLARTPGASVLARLQTLEPGMRLDHLPTHLRTKSYYFNAYGRLSWEQPAKTITKSCNYLGSGCFGHPELDRGITMREAARLQSFPDDFTFNSGTENSVAKQIGGAVPPLLARALGKTIGAHLKRISKEDLDVA